MYISELFLIANGQLKNRNVHCRKIEKKENEKERKKAKKMLFSALAVSLVVIIRAIFSDNRVILHIYD